MQSIAYEELLAALDLSNIRELEDLLITDCFHSGIIKGKLDQRAQCLHVHESIARDVRPQQLQPILDAIAIWCAARRPPSAMLSSGSCGALLGLQLSGRPACKFCKRVS